jgi:membrane protein
VTKSREDGLSTLAQAIAYSLFLAIPAAALVVLGVFSLVADPEAIDRVVDSAQGVMPAEAADLLRQSLERSARSTGSNVVLTVLGLALALWTTTSAASTLMTGLTRAFEEKDSRGLARRRLISLLIVFALVACAALVATFLVLGPHLERWLGSTLDAEGVTAWVWWTAQWPFLVAFLLLGFAAVLYLGPGADQHGLRHVFPAQLSPYSRGWSPPAASPSTRPASARTTRAGGALGRRRDARVAVAHERRTPVRCRGERRSATP